MDYKIVPFAVAIDTREQHPFSFRGIKGDSVDKYAPLVIRTELASLKSGDYSIVGFESDVSIERKSITDLFGTLGRGRERFERELVRLEQMRFAAVVVEGDWMQITRDPPKRTKLEPKTVFRSVIAFQQRYPHVHWWACPTRRFAEITTFQILRRFWADHESGKQQEATTSDGESKQRSCLAGSTTTDS